MAKRKRRYGKKAQSNFLSSSFAKSVARNAGYMAYGASREALSNTINKLPFVKRFAGFEIVDEVAIFGAAHIADKMMGRNKIPVLKDYVKAAKVVEMARIGVWGYDQIKGMGGKTPELEI